ncbi:glutamine synthetase type III [Thermoleophilia bacterium SCSIO 60948]|nr:glutamine synthetase type III [Thermoleophilia bacterium SCSIO 60948]
MPRSPPRAERSGPPGGTRSADWPVGRNAHAPTSTLWTKAPGLLLDERISAGRRARPTLRASLTATNVTSKRPRAPSGCARRQEAQDPVKIRQENVKATQWEQNGTELGTADLRERSSYPFGSLVFSPAVQAERLSSDTYQKLQDTLEMGQPLDPALADEVAEAMMEWALEHGATHFTHIFQPLTGKTAEKHDSFFDPVGDGTAIAQFRGKELIQGEPDASSFPTGGLRATFEARGYTAWDPTSPAFLLENPNGTLLCIPTAFASWTGEALDAKIPLLRSMDALSRAAVRALELLGDSEAQRVFTTVGPEQEYFLIDEQYFYSRPDLVTTGRTLFGAQPPKGHELDDHYFGAIPERILSCMLETEMELAKLGVPVKTRHNEVAPSQYEIAPVFENSNVGSDHQQLTMQVLDAVARKYGLVALLHEKPFDGVNGSGKHNNWSMGTDTGVNLMDPGDTPAENTNFMFFCAAVIQAVNKHQGLLRASVANIGQDHRLGANEAPPAIISIFLGDELDRAFETITTEGKDATTEGSLMNLGTEVLPELPKHGGDRNRTSPFAFTGNKFEFRALGSSMSLGFPNTVLNTIVAEAIDELSDKLEAKTGEGKSVIDAVAEVVADSYNANKQVCFAGDNYSDEWHAEAERRGLKNLRTTPDALPEVIATQTVETFERYNVLSERELESRYEVWLEQYSVRANIEAETTREIARTMLLPAALRHLALIEGAGVSALSSEARALIDEFTEAIVELERANIYPDGIEGMELAEFARDSQLETMVKVREVADRLEKVVADDIWPLAKYSEILFIK